MYKIPILSCSYALDMSPSMYGVILDEERRVWGLDPPRQVERLTELESQPVVSASNSDTRA